MHQLKIVIAGGTGFIGQEMIKYFGKDNSLTILTRNEAQARNNRNEYSSLTTDDLRLVEFVHWKATAEDADSNEQLIQALDGADLLINLAGKTVNCRYTEKNKREILGSRTGAVKALGVAIRKCIIPPKLWINSSSATIYRHATDHAKDEYTGEFHDGFSVQVCQQWETSFYEESTPNTRKIALRMAITLGPGGVLIPYFNLLKFKLGGAQGNGKQMFSWIHIEDTCRMIEWCHEHENLNGTFNCSSPNPVTNAQFMKTLRELTGHRVGLPAPSWLLKMGAVIIGTETELVLKSRWVIPTRIQNSGFQFKYPALKDALTDIIKEIPRKQYQLV